MAISVNMAFSDFFKNVVNLDSYQSDKAKSSREFLREQINRLSNNEQFIKTENNYDINFGSFARKTKIQPLDDVDIIVGLNGSDLIIEENQWDNINLKIGDNCSDKTLLSLCDKFSSVWQSNIQYLNSTKVKNKLISALQKVSQYQKAELHGRGEAVTLKLSSYDWNFDIVPAFYYIDKNNQKEYYIIPNGYGKWKKTNPKIEQERVTKLNQKFRGIVLNAIRLVKYWNRHRQMPNIASYVLETLVLDYFESIQPKENEWVDFHFRDIMFYVYSHITESVMDSKNIQGDINTGMTWAEKNRIKTCAYNDYIKSKDAINTELNEKDYRKSINLWRDIFGGGFPQYG